jgi:hypothetical protein
MYEIGLPDRHFSDFLGTLSGGLKLKYMQECRFNIAVGMLRNENGKWKSELSFCPDYCCLLRAIGKFVQLDDDQELRLEIIIALNGNWNRANK